MVKDWGIPTNQHAQQPLPACYLVLRHTNNHFLLFFFKLKKILSILVFFFFFQLPYQSYTFPRLADWIKKFKELVR